MRRDATAQPTDASLDVAPPLGGKARRLLELRDAGFPVPAFTCAPCDPRETLARLGPSVAVRSSASLEDGAEDSFAGQFRSFLDVRTEQELERAVAACLDSARAPSVAAYCAAVGADHEDLEMGVVVQRMLRPELSGVAFTVNPMTGADEVVIEACEGVGDALLSGTVDPLPPQHPLLARHAPAIERMARAIQSHFGAPQDVEFAVEDGTLYVLQARPVTRIRFAPGIGEWTNADFRDGGVSCTVCTPLMWSLYETVWQDALPGFLREIRLLGRDEDFQAGRMFFGRPYWNLGAVKRCLATLPGFVERRFDEDLQVQPRYEGDGVVTPVTLGGVLRALPTVLAVPRVWKRQARYAEAFLGGGFDALEADFEQTAPSDPTARLAARIEQVFRVTETNYFRTIFCASLAKLDFSEAFPDASDTALVGGLPPLRHMAPLRAIRAMAARGERDVEAIMRRFGHRGRNELDLRVPRWDEDPAFVDALFDCVPPVHGGDASEAYALALEQALAGLPRRQHKRFRKKLARLRRFLWLREEMRDLSTRVYHRIRKDVLAVAEARELGDDVFFMPWQAILADDRSGIARAREVFDGHRAFAAPNEIGARFPSAAPADAALAGIAAGPGTATGPAHVARDVTAAMAAPDGAILVCPFTDPGWTPVLSRVAGVVTENGGQLSHAAVICRELGIPAVLGVREATRRIRSGDTITIDGDQGTVADLRELDTAPEEGTS